MSEVPTWKRLMDAPIVEPGTEAGEPVICKKTLAVIDAALRFMETKPRDTRVLKLMQGLNEWRTRALRGNGAEKLNEKQNEYFETRLKDYGFDDDGKQDHECLEMLSGKALELEARKVFDGKFVEIKGIK